MLIVLQRKKVMASKYKASFLPTDKNELGIMISVMYGYNKIKIGDLNLN